MGKERQQYPSKIGEKHPNSKFAKGSKACDKRAVILAEIYKRMTQGKSFSDLQVGV